jgi:hypothetical protein
VSIEKTGPFRHLFGFSRATKMSWPVPTT